jgi:hypothetical protein
VVTSLKDLHSLKEREVVDAEERILKGLERAMEGGRVGVLDLMPDDFGRTLKGAGSYAFWTPPGDPEVAEAMPIASPASFLSSPEVRGARRIVVPLHVARNKAEFKREYGLSERLGVAFEDFMRLVEEGRLVLTLTASSDRYSADFYKDLFKACERAGYTPPRSGLRVDAFARYIRLVELAVKESIPPRKGWKDLLLERHPNLSPDKCMEDVKALLNEEALKELEIIFMEEGSTQRMLAAYLLSLRVWGFERIANCCLELMRRDAMLGAAILHDFHYYYVGGVVDALGGARLFDDLDARNLAASRLRPEEQLPPPASLSLAVQRPVECLVVRRPNRDDVRSLLKEGPDDELASCVGGFQRAANDYDLVGAVNHYERLREVVSKRYDGELKDRFRRSKVVRGSMRGCIGLTSSAIALHSIPAGLTVLLSVLKGGEVWRGVEELPSWLAEGWPLLEKGLPFFLWKYA